MNDRHPSGTMTTPAPASDADPAHYAAYGAQEAQYGDFTTYGDHTVAGASFHSDPLFGSLPGEGQATGAYDATQWQTAGGQTLNYDPYAARHHAAYDSGAYDSTAWTIPAPAPSPETVADNSGHWDANAWLQPDQSGMAGATQQWEWGTQAFDTGVYDATQWNSDGTPAQTAEPEHGLPYGEFEAPGEFGEFGEFEEPTSRTAGN